MDSGQLKIMKYAKIDVMKYLLEVGAEVERAASINPKFNSAHEAYAVLQEEVDEMWDAIKKNDTNHARREAVQVAAMAIRFLIDVKQK